MNINDNNTSITLKIRKSRDKRPMSLRFPVNRRLGILGNPDPKELWIEILDQIPDDFWSRPNLKILNVACGHGTEADLIVARMKQAGVSIPDIKNSIYLLDKYTMFVEVAKDRGYTNVIKEDFLEYEPDMKFDLVIGNPPFQENLSSGVRKSKKENLWAKFWHKSLTVLSKEDNGIVALITPSTWTSPGKDLGGKIRLWDLFDSYSSYANVSTVKHYFSNVGSTFSYVIVDKSGKNGLRFSNNESKEFGFLPPDSTPETLKEMRSKLSKETPKTIDSFYIGRKNSGIGKRVVVPITRSLSSKTVIVLSDNEPLPNGFHEKEDMHFYIHAGQNSDLVRNKIIDAIPLINKLKWSGFLSLKLIKMIRVFQE